MAETPRGSRGGRGKGSSRSGGSRSSTRSGAGRSSSKRTTASRSRSSARSRSSTQASRKAAARKGGKARGRQQTARKRARQTGSAAARAPVAELSGKSAAELRDIIAKSVVAPLNLVMLTRDRIQEVMDDAVSRGRVTADDAQDLARSLLERGRKQTNAVLGDFEQLLGRGGAGDPVGDARKAAGRARDQVGD